MGIWDVFVLTHECSGAHRDQKPVLMAWNWSYKEL